MVGFSASAKKNKCDPYSPESEDNNAVAVSPDKLIVVDELRALPQTSADELELEVFKLKLRLQNLCHSGCWLETGAI